MPFAETPELNGPTTWVEPKAVAEVAFHSWTDDGHLRAPVFLRMRDDIDPKAVRRGQDSHAPAPHRPTAGPIDDIVAQLANREGGVDARRRAAPDQADASRSRLLARRRRAKQPALTKRDLLRISRRCRRTSCRISPTGR